MGKKIILFVLEIYRKFISPMKAPCCKYYPSCSEYARQAVIRYGALKGIAMAIWRLLRCNPFSNGGFDPVK